MEQNLKMAKSQQWLEALSHNNSSLGCCFLTTPSKIRRPGADNVYLKTMKKNTNTFTPRDFDVAEALVGFIDDAGGHGILYLGLRSPRDEIGLLPTV